MAGSAILRTLEARGYTSVLTRTHAELDLCDQVQVSRFFSETRPAHVYLAAARVGGIRANDTYRADFIYQNLMIAANVIHSSHNAQVEKLLFLGSSCIYPRLAVQPILESALLQGALEPTNEPYAIAKIAGIKLCAAYNRQYGTNYLSVMPTNLYGPGDNYHPENSHALPALIRRFHEAKVESRDRVVVWGTGTPLREFLYSEDLADACVFVMENLDARQTGEHLNVGTGKEIAIIGLAKLVAEIVGYRGRIEQDPSKPDGAPRKLLDVTRLAELGWTARTSLRRGVELAYDDFLRNHWEPSGSTADVPGGSTSATQAPSARNSRDAPQASARTTNRGVR